MTIALDIDGTITDRNGTVPKRTVEYLTKLHREGYEIIFATGRPFSYAKQAVRDFDFPFFIALQNGADIVHMPEQGHVASIYLGRRTLNLIDQYYKGYVVYSGYEHGDFCYYRPQYFQDELLSYFKDLEKLSSKPWQPVDDFDHITATPLVKCIGPEKELIELQSKITGAMATLIHDPINPKYHLLLITHRNVSKGKAIEHVLHRRPLIAAGDDMNDISMLHVADTKIVMKKAPKIMHTIANIVCDNIVDGLEQALA